MLSLFETSPLVAPLLTLGIVALMFVLFVRETFPTEVTALAGAALMLVVGVLPYENALGVLSNPAPWTIAAMFIVMGALVRTGALDVLTRQAEKQAQTRPKGIKLVSYVPLSTITPLCWTLIYVTVSTMALHSR